MPEPPEAARRPGSRRALAIVGACVAVLLVAAAASAIMLTRPNAPASRPSAQAPAPSAPRDIPLSAGKSEGAGLLTEKNAKAVVTTVLNVKTTDSDGADALKRRLSKLVKGAYLAELQAQQQELEVNGWKIIGDAKVVSVRVGTVDTSAKAATATVRACIDTAATRTVDAKGKPMPAPAGGTRAWHIFTLAQNHDGTWAVTKHTFPNNPAC